MDPQVDSCPIFDLLTALSEAMDLVSPLVMDHHKKTAWFAVHVAGEMGLGAEGVKEALFASLLHDIGAFSLQDRLDTLDFEFDNPHHHACLGYSLLKDFEPFAREARIILAHHTWWKPADSGQVGGRRVPVVSHVVHLADRVAILLDEVPSLPHHVEDLLGPVLEGKGSIFMPEAVDALLDLAGGREFWTGAFEPGLEDRLRSMVETRFLVMGSEDLEPLSRVFARIIDYRSHFTATHSAGVAAVAEELARSLGFSGENCRLMKVAGYLHDLGKIAIPTEILEKPGKLEAVEYHRVQDHVVLTRKLLQRIPQLGFGIRWASEHHERLNGRGYPDHSSGRDIAFGSRVVAMADIFAAVTEDRPYRMGMNGEKARKILARLTGEGYLDREIFGVVEKNFDRLNQVRAGAQQERLEDYRVRVECFTEAAGPSGP